MLNFKDRGHVMTSSCIYRLNYIEGKAFRGRKYKMDQVGQRKNLRIQRWYDICLILATNVKAITVEYLSVMIVTADISKSKRWESSTRNKFERQLIRHAMQMCKKIDKSCTKQKLKKSYLLESQVQAGHLTSKDTDFQDNNFVNEPSTSDFYETTDAHFSPFTCLNSAGDIAPVCGNSNEILYHSKNEMSTFPTNFALGDIHDKYDNFFGSIISGETSCDEAATD